MQNLPECFLRSCCSLMPTAIIPDPPVQRHPSSAPALQQNLSLESAIDEESDLLEPLRSRADLIVDTSEMSVHELAECCVPDCWVNASVN